MRELLRNIWTRIMLRGIHYRDRHEQFDRLYRVQNPWRMDTESEKSRFEETNRLIQMHFGPVNTLLEIGCGEGHQTARLGELCKTIYAIDISARAIERARQRYPRAIFDVGDIFSAPIFKSTPRFDLVVACEVLYYMSDIPTVLARMEQLGGSCFVTYVSEQHEQLAPLLERLPRQNSATFTYNGVSWRALWWSVKPN